MLFIPNEISRKIWSFLFPISEIKNNSINDSNKGTSVNNIFNKINYCNSCGEISEINKCKYCNMIKYSKCLACKKTTICYDICCVEEYNKYQL